MFRCVVLLIATVAFAADVRIVEEIAVKVNGDIITRGDLADKQRQTAEYLQREEHLTGAALQQALTAQSKDMLRSMIDERLLVQKAKELDIKVEGEVNRRMAELQVMSKLADNDKFHDWIHEQTGMTYEDYRQQVTDGYLTQRLVGSEIQSHISVPEPEMQKYYDEHKAQFVRKEEVFLSQILISTEGKTPEQVATAEKKAQDIAARAKKGEKFGDLARQNSDDTATSRDGGQLPPSERGLMRPEIETLVFAAKKGTVLDPIKTPLGFVIIRIDDRFDAGQESFDEAKDQIQGVLAQPKMEPKMREYLTKLRQQAFLEIKDGYVDTGAAPGKDTRWHEVVGLKPETTTKEEVAAHRRRKKFLGVIPHGSVAPGTKETSAAGGVMPPSSLADTAPPVKPDADATAAKPVTETPAMEKAAPEAAAPKPAAATSAPAMSAPVTTAPAASPAEAAAPSATPAKAEKATAKKTATDKAAAKKAPAKKTDSDKSPDKSPDK